MKSKMKTEILPLLIIVIAIILGFYFYSVFPDQVPLHWNVYGQVDSWGSRLQGAIIGPAILTGIYLLFLLIPLIDPKKEKYDQFAKTYLAIRLLLMLVIFGVFLIAALAGLGYKVRIEVWIPVLIGLLFIFLGNYMGKIKSNWFIGIRTPWTLSNDEVWDKTHRLGGKLFMLLGLFMLTAPILPGQFIFLGMIILIIVLTAVTTIYSYVLFKKYKKNEPGIAERSDT